MQRTYAVHVIGCRTNQYEAEAFKKQLRSLGFRAASEIEVADVCLIHTCAVTEGAESSSRHAIRGIIARHPHSRVIVTGCLAKKDSASLRAIDGVTEVVATEDRESIMKALFPEETVGPFCIDQFEGHTRAFVKVQDGCNHFCAYCIVPHLRGRSRSRVLSEIVAEAQGLVCSGYKEIVLTGVNIGDYVDGEKQLADVIRAIDAIEGLHRLRLSSINPNEIDDRLIDTMLSGRSFCPSTHLVAQSGSNQILQRMGRRYTKELYLEKVARLREQSPDWMFSTDIIVGFPGETEEDVRETLELIAEAKFSKVHLFPYSKRSNTRAARFSGEIPQEVIKERKRHISEAAERMAVAVREPYIGRAMEVLVESGTDGDFLQAQTANGLPVLIIKESIEPNQLVTVRLKENGPNGLIGVVE